MKLIQNTFLAAILFTMIACQNDSQLFLPAVFSDNLVLKQNTEVTIWGKATPGSEVSVTGEWGASSSTSVRNDSTWQLDLSTSEAGGPYTVTVNNDGAQVKLNNVMLGEVWLASGQSNMEMPLEGWPPNDTIENSKQAIAEAENPNIRMFTVTREMSSEPEDDVDGSWKVSTPENARNFSATAWFFAQKLNARLNVPVGIIHSSWGGTPIEAWISNPKLSRDDDFASATNASESRPERSMTLSSETPTVLYNAMIAPLVPFNVNGTIWYQGESNVGRAAQYRRLKQMLVEDWRENFDHPDMPFYYVQIAPYNYDNPDGISSALLRDAQRRSLDIPATGMAVTLDIGNIDNIHPGNKKDVGHRLARWTLAREHGKDIPYSGPLPAATEINDNQITIEFEHADELVLKEDVPNQFEIAGEDGQFYPAKADIQGTSIVLSSPQVPNPANARYAFTNGASAALFNKAGLPASSFTTEAELE
ncbi:MAG: sialate O-acetylesterase [Marinilabilia sp.]